LFFGLFPIITAALRFNWIAGFIAAAGIVLVYGLMALSVLPPQADLYDMSPVFLNMLILLFATAVKFPSFTFFKFS
jgi:hypothetical protein